jgi:IclR family transcriptional regulator, KDG regulon repressor
VTDHSPNPIKSLAKVLLILECFSRDERGLGLAEIASRTRLPKATTHRLLAALKAIGFIEQPHDGDQYRLGMKLFELGSCVLANMELPREAQPFVDRLAALSGATVHLCVFDGAQAVLIDRRRDDSETRNTLTLLEGAPVHCTSVGKAMLAWQPERVVDRIIRAGLTSFTANTITDAHHLKAELARIRERGWALDDAEHQPNLRCIAAPIRGGTGQVIAAISVSGPDNLVSPDKDDANVRLVCGIAGEFSRRLGYVPPDSATPIELDLSA